MIIVVITVPIGFVLASVAPFGRHLNVQGTRCIIKDHGHWFRSTLESALLDPTCPEEHLLPIRSCIMCRLQNLLHGIDRSGHLTPPSAKVHLL